MSRGLESILRNESDSFWLDSMKLDVVVDKISLVIIELKVRIVLF